MSDAHDELPDALFLRSLAQNDYMIDGGFLPDGARLNDIAARLEALSIVEEMEEDLMKEIDMELQRETAELRDRIAELEAQVDEYIRDRNSHGGALEDWCRENGCAE